MLNIDQFHREFLRSLKSTEGHGNKADEKPVPATAEKRQAKTVSNEPTKKRKIGGSLRIIFNYPIT